MFPAYAIARGTAVLLTNTGGIFSLTQIDA